MDNELPPIDENQPEDLTVSEMINVCRGHVPEELLDGAELMEPEELLGLLVGELPNHGIEDPVGFLLEARRIEKVWPDIEFMFDSLHDKGVDKNISAVEFAHLHGITSKFIQPADLDSVIDQTDIPAEIAEKWRQEMEATTKKLIIAQIRGQIIGRININKEPEGSIESIDKRATTTIDDLWLHPDFLGQRVEDYLVLAAENYVINTRELPRRSAIRIHQDMDLLGQAAKRLGYVPADSSGDTTVTKALRWEP